MNSLNLIDFAWIILVECNWFWILLGFCSDSVDGDDDDDDDDNDGDDNDGTEYYWPTCRTKTSGARLRQSFLLGFCWDSVEILLGFF